MPARKQYGAERCTVPKSEERLTPAEALAKVYAIAAGDTSFELRQLREQSGDRFVPGVGNPEADVVFVGEAPGATEHRTGRPFVGAAGKVLDELLKSVHLTREEVYITNAVHWRPVTGQGKNRTPDPEEVQACRKYLLSEVRIISPNLLVTLGKVPLSAVLGERYRIGACHGRLYRAEDWEPARVLALYHPAVGVYQRSMKPVLRQDFSKVRTFLDQQVIA
jgi:uracil-DNA glycosylase